MPPRSFPRLLGRGVRFAAIEQADSTPKNPRWMQVAYEGDFVYRGRAIRFDRALFETLIENFRAHPTYKANPGAANVVHFDYEHASEMDPREGSIPSTGAPAPAWVQDLEVRDGENGAELWSLTNLGPTILKQITTDPPEYQWTSVAIAPKYPSPTTGEDQGPTLTSIAFTNDPFLQGMVPISIAASMTVWVDKAESPEQAKLGLCEIFGLPIESEASVIVEHLQRFTAMLTEGIEVEGIELDGMLGQLRRLFGLPTLSTRDEVLSAAMAALSYDPNISPPQNAGTTAETQMELSKKLAATFRVNEHDETILAAAEKVQASADAMDTLMGILGASDFQAALTAAKGLVEKTSGMGEIVAQLAAAMERIGQVDKQDAEAEAEAVVASRVAMMGLSGNAAKVASDSLRPAIVAMRMGCVDKDPKAQEAKLAEFRRTYPLPDADRALLTRRIFAGPGGTQYGLTADAHGNLHSAAVSQPITTSNAAARSDGRNPERIALCRDFEGANETAKAVAYLRKERPGFVNLDSIAQVKRAGEWLRASN